MKPKDKIKVDELLNSLNTGDIKELMSPTKPLKRQMHIEILNWKDNKVKDKLAIKPKDNINKMIVEFNVANREILKVRKFKGELKQLYELLRIKQYINKYGMSINGINGWLNDVMFPQLRTEDGNKLDYGKLHERIFLCNKGTMSVPMVLGVHYKDEVDGDGKLVNYAGDITKFGLLKKVEWKDIKEMLKVATRMFWKNIGKLRLVINNGTRDNINRVGNVFLRDCGWYRAVNGNGYPDGYFPYKTMKKDRLNVVLHGSKIILNTGLLEYHRRTGTVRPRTSISIRRIEEIRNRVRNDLESDLNEEVDRMRDEDYDIEEIDARLSEMVEEEVDRRLELRRETERQREAEREREGEVDGNSVAAEAMLRERRRHRETTRRILEENRFDNLPVGTRVIVEHGNGNSRNDNLPNGRTECTITDARHLYHAGTRRVVYFDRFDYMADFPDGRNWYIKTEEIIEVLDREETLEEVRDRILRELEEE